MYFIAGSASMLEVMTKDRETYHCKVITLLRNNMTHNKMNKPLQHLKWSQIKLQIFEKYQAWIPVKCITAAKINVKTKFTSFTWVSCQIQIHIKSASSCSRLFPSIVHTWSWYTVDTSYLRRIQVLPQCVLRSRGWSLTGCTQMLLQCSCTETRALTSGNGSLG